MHVARTCIVIAQISQFRQFFALLGVLRTNSVEFRVSREFHRVVFWKFTEHTQTHRVPTIASPRILRPIYTHTPATGFPYQRPRGYATSRIGDAVGCPRSRLISAFILYDLLRPMARRLPHRDGSRNVKHEGPSSIHSSGCGGRAALANTRIAFYVAILERTRERLRRPIRSYRDHSRARALIDAVHRR